jgi:hypothetical protein
MQLDMKHAWPVSASGAKQMNGLGACPNMTYRGDWGDDPELAAFPRLVERELQTGALS